MNDMTASSMSHTDGFESLQSDLFHRLRFDDQGLLAGQLDLSLVRRGTRRFTEAKVNVRLPDEFALQRSQLAPLGIGSSGEYSHWMSGLVWRPESA